MTIQTFTDTQSRISQFAQLHNARVRKYFKRNPRDQSEEARTRQYLSSSLQIDPTKASKLDCIFECLRFELQVANALSGLAPVYGIPVQQFQSEVAFKPQIMLKFREREINQADLPLRKYKLEKEISFRLLEKNIPKNNIQLKALATKIKAKFWVAGKAYSYTSGLTNYRYKDDENGYRLAIDLPSKATAAKLIDLLLDIQGVKYDESKLSYTKFTKPTVVEKQTILSNRVNKPIRGRTGKLYLYQVEYKHNGIVDKVLINQMGNIRV
jgi:hypothetical protein